MTTRWANIRTNTMATVVAATIAAATKRHGKGDNNRSGPSSLPE